MGFSGSGYAMIGIIYLDAEEEMLGITRIINFNESLFAGTAFVGAPDKLSDTNTIHNLTIESNKVYKTFSIDIKKEINNNLLGIDPEEIRFIQDVYKRQVIKEPADFVLRSIKACCQTVFCAVCNCHRLLQVFYRMDHRDR